MRENLSRKVTDEARQRRQSARSRPPADQRIIRISYQWQDLAPCTRDDETAPVWRGFREDE